MALQARPLSIPYLPIFSDFPLKKRILFYKLIPEYAEISSFKHRHHQNFVFIENNICNATGDHYEKPINTD
jgi:hypothetical protein